MIPCALRCGCYSFVISTTVHEKTAENWNPSLGLKCRTRNSTVVKAQQTKKPEDCFWSVHLRGRNHLHYFRDDQTRARIHLLSNFWRNETVQSEDQNPKCKIEEGGLNYQEAEATESVWYCLKTTPSTQRAAQRGASTKHQTQWSDENKPKSSCLPLTRNGCENH